MSYLDTAAVLATVPAVCGVYLFTDLHTNKTYVGASKNIRTRTIQHLSRIAVKTTHAPYLAFASTYGLYGTEKFLVRVLEVCTEEALLDRELFWMRELRPTENTMRFTAKGVAFSEDERGKRAERTKTLWATPEYRAKAVAARVGKAYNKGYKCTPEQVINRKRAGRLSNIRRNYGSLWREEYVRRYPEHAGDVDGE